MGSPALIGLGAGLVSGVLFISAATGTALAMILFYLAPMPGFLAGLGWGWMAAALAAVAGTLLASAAMGPIAGLSFLVMLGAPTAFLCYLALLSRAPAPAVVTGQMGADSTAEWYPPGRLVAWATVIAGAVAGLTVAMLGVDTEGYRATLRELLENSLLPQLDPEATEGLDGEAIDAMVDILARLLPAGSAVLWLAVALFNMWAAARIIEASGRPLRPWPDIQAMTYPSLMILGFTAALLVSLIPGIFGTVATGFMGAYMLAYTLLGLVVVHVATQPLALRTLLLVTLYLGIFLFGWPALIVALIGLGEPVFKLRERAIGNRRPPTPPSNDAQ